MLHTRICELLEIDHPIISAPMAGAAAPKQPHAFVPRAIKSIPVDNPYHRYSWAIRATEVIPQQPSLVPMPRVITSDCSVALSGASTIAQATSSSVPKSRSKII